jgi:hypothetical protein
MRAISDGTDPDERKRAMTEKKGKAEGSDVKALLASDDAFIRTVVRAALQEVLEAERSQTKPWVPGGVNARYRAAAIDRTTMGRRWSK